MTTSIKQTPDGSADYYPDCWVIVKIQENNAEPLYKLFAQWYGGYASGDCWKINSGIESITLMGDCYYIAGSSGSVYCCVKNCYRLSSYGSSVLNNMIENTKSYGVDITILEDRPDWTELC
jgi:hypothetical protein